MSYVIELGGEKGSFKVQGLAYQLGTENKRHRHYTVFEITTGFDNLPWNNWQPISNQTKKG
jgi:hypothetical protein